MELCKPPWELVSAWERQDRNFSNKNKHAELWIFMKYASGRKRDLEMWGLMEGESSGEEGQNGVSSTHGWY